MRGTRALLAAVIGMGVLIVAGVAVIGVVIVQRGLGGTVSPAEVVLPAALGTHITGLGSAGPDRVLVQLGGGEAPERVVVVDLKTGRIVATIRLTP